MEEATARLLHLAFLEIRFLTAAWQPPPRRRPQRGRPRVLEPVMAIVDEMLREDLTAPRKQKHTVDPHAVLPTGAGGTDAGNCLDAC